MRPFLVILAVVFLSSPQFAIAAGKKKPKPTPTPAPTQTATPIKEHGEFIVRVLSYNIHGLSLPWTDTSNMRKIGKILRKKRDQGTAPHLVAIQEGFHRDVQQLIDEAGYPYVRTGPGPTWPRTNSGLVILSEFPIIGYRTHAFDLMNSAGADWNANKGLVYVKVELPGMAEPVEILNTHLQADYDDFTASLSETIGARRRQIAEVANFMWRYTNPNGPVIFVGDVNTNTSIGDYYDIISRTGLTDAAETCAITQACLTNTDVMGQIRNSLDHQFYRSGLKAQLMPSTYLKTFNEPVDGKALSDHDGLEVEYEVSW